jgi:hypothetical protein
MSKNKLKFLYNIYFGLIFISDLIVFQRLTYEIKNKTNFPKKYKSKFLTLISKWKNHSTGLKI